MSDFIERLKIERNELDTKLSKLKLFIETDGFKSINLLQQSLLKIQAQAMETYYQCLEQRLVWLELVKDEPVIAPE